MASTRVPTSLACFRCDEYTPGRYGGESRFRFRHCHNRNCGPAGREAARSVRLLVPDCHAVSGRLQRQCAEVSGHLPRCGPWLAVRPARFPRSNRGRIVRSPFHSVLHERRLSRRPLQQALRDHRHQVDGNRRDAICARGSFSPQSPHGSGSRVPLEHAGGLVRTFQVRFVAGTPSGERAVLGQRRHRVGHVSRRHHGDHGRRHPQSHVRGPPVVVGNNSSRFHAPRSVVEFRYFARGGRESSSQVPLESPGRPRRAVAGHLARPRPELGGVGKYLPVGSCRAAAIHHRCLRPRRLARG